MATPKFSNLPLAARDRSFDKGQAKKRIEKWAAPSADDPDKVDEKKYVKAFFWYNSKGKDDDSDGLPDNLGDYKLIFCDVIDGKLTAIPTAIFAAGAVMQGARGGVNIPDSDRAAAKAHMEKYYEKMAKEFNDDSIKAPWKRSAQGEVEYRSYKTALTVEPEQRSKGIASVFGQETQLFGDFYEQIDSGAFDNVLDSDVRVLFNHNPDKILGRTSAGTAAVSKTAEGLAYEWDPPETSYSKDLQVSLERGDVNQSSFGFTIKRQRFEEREDGSILRTVLEVGELFDVSPVVFPAYQGTTVSRSTINQFEEARKNFITDDETGSVFDPASLERLQRSINLKRKQIGLLCQK